MSNNTPHRISNHSLSRLLSVVVQLGGSDISSRVFVEACKDKGLTIGDAYFLHFDTLFDYGFLASSPSQDESRETVTASEPSSTVEASDNLIGGLFIEKNADLVFSLTHSGLEFLHRYGRA